MSTVGSGAWRGRNGRETAGWRLWSVSLESSAKLKPAWNRTKRRRFTVQRSSTARFKTAMGREQQKRSVPARPRSGRLRPRNEWCLSGKSQCRWRGCSTTLCLPLRPSTGKVRTGQPLQELRPKIGGRIFYFLVKSRCIKIWKGNLLACSFHCSLHERAISNVISNCCSGMNLLFHTENLNWAICKHKF